MSVPFDIEDMTRFIGMASAWADALIQLGQDPLLIDSEEWRKKFTHFYIVYSTISQVRSTYRWDDDRSKEHNELAQFIEILNICKDFGNKSKEKILTHANGETVIVTTGAHQVLFVAATEPLPSELEFKLQTDLNYLRVPFTNLHDVLKGKFEKS